MAGAIQSADLQSRCSPADAAEVGHSTISVNNTNQPDPATERQILAWLDAFSEAVRDVDYETGKTLFAPDVVGFGTVGVLLHGLDTLMNSQWKRVWSVTSGFCFDMDQVTACVHGNVAWVLVPWASRTGKADRGPLDRKGRATYILERRNGQWLAVHTHHSLDPSGCAPGNFSRRKTDNAKNAAANSAR
jgi:ketosteroid isomerase-like protein